MKPTNLDQLISRRTQFTYKGEVINVAELTQAEFLELLEIEAIQDTAEAVKRQADLIKRKIAQGGNKKLSDKEFDALPRAAVVAIWRDMVFAASNTVTDPN